MEQTDNLEKKPLEKTEDELNPMYKIAAEKLATSCLAEHLPHLQHGKEQITQLK